MQCDPDRAVSTLAGLPSDHLTMLHTFLPSLAAANATANENSHNLPRIANVKSDQYLQPQILGQMGYPT